MNEILLLEVDGLQNGGILWNNSKNYINFSEKIFLPMEFEIVKITRSANFAGDVVEVKMLYSNDFAVSEVIEGIAGRKTTLRRSIDGINYDVVISGIISFFSTKTTEFAFHIQDDFFRFKESVLNVYTKKCKTSFCSKQCALKLEDFSYNMQIINVDRSSIVVDGILPNVLFVGGIAKLKNKNFTKNLQIRDTSSNEVFFFEDVPSFLKIGDYATISQACDKTYEMCGKFGNQVNFRGEIVV